MAYTMSYNYSRSPLYTQQQLAFSLDYIIYIWTCTWHYALRYMYTAAAQIVLRVKAFFIMQRCTCVQMWLTQVLLLYIIKLLILICYIIIIYNIYVFCDNCFKMIRT